MNDEEKPAQVDEDVVEVDLIADAGLLVGLVEKTAADPGAPFAPEILASLADLRRTDRAAFETLRAELERVGCRVTALDDALTEEVSPPNARTQTQADILLRLSPAADLFHAPDGACFADLDINGHRETWPIRSKGFSRWLARSYYGEAQSASGSEALQSALNVIEAKAHYDAIELTAHVRVASLDGNIYIDLAARRGTQSKFAPTVGKSSMSRQCDSVAHRARLNCRRRSAAGR